MNEQNGYYFDKCNWFDVIGKIATTLTKVNLVGGSVSYKPENNSRVKVNNSLRIKRVSTFEIIALKKFLK